MSASYTLTDDELDTVFPNGCMIVRDALTGICTAVGRNRFGASVRLAINVPLCSGCDAVMHDGVCRDCDEIPDDVKALGSGRFQVAA